MKIGLGIGLGNTFAAGGIAILVAGATPTQNSWVKSFDSAGNPFYIPVWR